MRQQNEPDSARRRQQRPSEKATTALLVVVGSMTLLSPSSAFTSTPFLPRPNFLKMSDNNDSSSSNNNWENNAKGSDANLWRSSLDEEQGEDYQDDWKAVLQSKQDGSFWSEFEPSDENDETMIEDVTGSTEDIDDTTDRDAEAWLETLASISAEEVEFNMVEAKRADKAREMAEWGFDKETIQNTFGVAMDDSLETSDEVEGFKTFREQAYLDDEDWKVVESHTKVEKDPETGEPIRQQMVYVDEHTCIGCTNCAMIAQSTFFMQEEHGRARVFQQWGDDDETIQVAIETCPVDCIHYVPYDELVSLEVERRDQNINFKARLVSQAEYGNSLSHLAGGPNGFTAPQKISGNMKARCNNCPSNGCKNCPMYGVGKNPEFERKEKIRLEKIERRKLQQQRQEEKKSAEL